MGLAYTDAEPSAPHTSPVRGHAGLRHFTHPVDGKTMVVVEEGVFQYGSNNRLVWLPAFYIVLTPGTRSCAGHPVLRASQ
jgi:hypothetical protein